MLSNCNLSIIEIIIIAFSVTPLFSNYGVLSRTNSGGMTLHYQVTLAAFLIDEMIPGELVPSKFLFYGLDGTQVCGFSNRSFIGPTM